MGVIIRMKFDTKIEIICVKNKLILVEVYQGDVNIPETQT